VFKLQVVDFYVWNVIVYYVVSLGASVLLSPL